jgi:hypothetical protein
MKLYEITGELQKLIEDIEEGCIPEEAIADTLGMVEEDFLDKVDNVACAFKNLLAEAEAIKAEADKLKDRFEKKKAVAERLKEYLSLNLQAVGKDKYESAKNQISFRKSEALALEDEAGFIEWCKKWKNEFLTVKEPTITVDKKAVKEALANGFTHLGAKIETKMNIQIK